MATSTSENSLNYTVGRSQLIVSYQDITKLAADAIVSSDDSALTMSGGVSAAIRAAAGDDVYDDAQKAVQGGQVRVGDVVVTRAGRLKAKYVFHAAVIEKIGSSARAEVIRKVVRRCLELCTERGLRSIAFPALGIGAGNLKPEDSASAIIVETTSAYLNGGAEIDRVLIALDPSLGGERVERFFRKIEQYLQLSASARHVDQVAEDFGRFSPPKATVSVAPQIERLTELRHDLDNSMIGVDAANFTALSAPKTSAALRKACEALDAKLAEAIAKGVDDPANTRFKADRLRVQIERARLAVDQLDMEDHAAGGTTDERRQRREYFRAEEKRFKSELDAINLNSKPLVLSLHGIRTRGAWQKAMNRPLQVAGFTHEPIDYGHFGLLQFLLPSARERQVDVFRDKYCQMGMEMATGNPSLIAHSLGSYIATKAMAKYNLKFDRIILCGAIVETDFDWDTLIRGGCATQVLNDYGGLDIWTRVAEYVVADAGRSGLKGFVHTARGKLVNRHHKRFQHSDYFYADNYDIWIRFLQGEVLNPTVNPQGSSANWRFRLTLLGLVLVILALAYLFILR